MLNMSSEEKIPQTSSFSSPSLAATSSSPPPSSYFIGTREDIVQARRVTKLVNGCRDILVLYHQGKLHAMDMRCYHAGGPLQQGDIEYKITLAEGEGLYQAVDDPTAKPLRTYWRSKGIKQRIHKVSEVNGNVYVTLNDTSETIESDSYQTDRYRSVLPKVQAPQPKPRPKK